MKHYQIKKECEICKRTLIADIQSIGTEHQNIMAITCEECAKSAGGRIMKDGEVEIL